MKNYNKPKYNKIYLKQRKKREYYIFIKLKHFLPVNEYQYKTKRIIQNGRTIVSSAITFKGRSNSTS